MKGTKYIVKKELDRVFGDKKLIFSLFIMPAVLVIFMYGLIGQMQSKMESDIEKHTTSMIVEDAPEGFSEFVKQSGFKGKIKYFTREENLPDKIEKYKGQIKNGKLDVMVVFDEGFSDKIASYKTGDAIPEIKTYYNPSEDYSSKGREEFVNIVLSAYKQQLLAERIGDLEQITIFNIDVDKDSSIIMDEKKAGGKALGMMLPYLITFMLFASAMSLGIDAITGEKERGTLSSMLISPVKRSEIVAGKIFSLSILSCLSAIVYSVSMVVGLPVMFKGMTDNMGGLKIDFSVVQIIELFVIMLSMVILYVTIISLVAVVARTTKEANTYIVPIYIIVLVAGMLTMFGSNTQVQNISYAIPVYGSAVAMQSLFSGELSALGFLLCVGGNIIVACIIGVCITKAFNSEKVMFNA